ncbi:hypothetical protein GCM10009539_66870 [Cryptosporangium japonicum]|uniref:Uncharacterized protein n=1 Tax=Cryptosporangium japonicum TaxID=80872 RepID=A0ABN0V1I4_9ACTN
MGSVRAGPDRTVTIASVERTGSPDGQRIHTTSAARAPITTSVVTTRRVVTTARHPDRAGPGIPRGVVSPEAVSTATQ